MDTNPSLQKMKVDGIVGGVFRRKLTDCKMWRRQFLSQRYLINILPTSFRTEVLPRLKKSATPRFGRKISRERKRKIYIDREEDINRNREGGGSERGREGDIEGERSRKRDIEGERGKERERER